MLLDISVKLALPLKLLFFFFFFFFFSILFLFYILFLLLLLLLFLPLSSGSAAALATADAHSPVGRRCLETFRGDGSNLMGSCLMWAVVCLEAAWTVDGELSVQCKNVDVRSWEALCFFDMIC